MGSSFRVVVIAALLCPAAGLALTAGGVAQETRAARPVPDSRTVGEARDTGLRWLAEHQEQAGHWSAAGFQDRCPADDRCGGAGDESQDVFVTSLCVLAFLGAGSTTTGGPHQAVVTRAVGWLRASQDADGLFGSRYQQSVLHAGHGAATLALSEAFLLGRDRNERKLQDAAQKGIDYILKFRTQDGAWHLKTRAGEPSAPSVWMLMAIVSAASARLTVDDAETVPAEFLAWLDQRTDPASGLVSFGPESRSGGPARGGQPPPNTAGALCAAGLLSRLFLGQRPADHAVLHAAAKTLAGSLAGAESAGPVDPGLLYFGSFAMFQMGGDHWARWKDSAIATMLGTQVRKAHLAGSWDPAAASLAQGRIGATAMNLLAIQVQHRMARMAR